MPRSDDLHSLPENLPIPVDDGACDHLLGLTWPTVALPSTRGGNVDLSRRPGLSVIYAYPRTGQPDRDPPPGWDEIPGARGCTPQSCSFRDHHRELLALGAEVYGLAVNPPEYQLEAATRLRLSFELLSDERLELMRALRLPTFDVAGMTLLRRFTLIVRGGRIEHVFYPVFPPDRNADDVIAWLRSNSRE